MPVIPLEELLDAPSDHYLGQIVHIARKMDSLTESLREGLPEALAENLVAAATRENRELVIVGSSSAWAARLRFESNEIMENARRQGIDVERCRVIVQTSPHL